MNCTPMPPPVIPPRWVTGATRIEKERGASPRYLFHTRSLGQHAHSFGQLMATRQIHIGSTAQILMVGYIAILDDRDHLRPEAGST